MKPMLVQDPRTDPPKEAVPGAGRQVLDWFGVDVPSVVHPLDRSRTCLEAGCSRSALVGELVCPVHLGIATAAEMPDHREAAAHRGERLGRTLALAVVLAVGGAALGLVVSDARFGWLGGVAAAAAVAGAISRELRLVRLGASLGMLAFFMAVVLAVSGLLVATIAALPWLLDRVLG
ncbi:MAG TPA: hypothetical protein VN033_14295 [Vulgatibacter sp.]|nr:hypothetical protein [Vulgatibacter sp.]